VQNPLTSLVDDVADTRRILALHDGPVILAGHSFAGTVITEAGMDQRGPARRTGGHLNSASGYGLSLLTWGREWDWVTLRSASSSATGLGRHRGAAVGAEAELTAGDALFRAGRADELLGQDGGLAGGDHPADRVPPVDVEDDVEVVIGPFRRAVQLGDVPVVSIPALGEISGY
jgi:hypothetical protein